MIFHTVSGGQTLYAIARDYGVAPGLIARVNGLRDPERLAVGQSLLILFPAQLHTVRAGESLGAIAAAYGTSVLQLLRNNPNLGGLPELFPGQVLVIAWTDRPGRRAAVNGYAYPYVDEGVLRGILPYATWLTPFTYGVSETGGLVGLEDRRLIALAREYGVSPLMHLSTLTEAGAFSNDRAAYVLAEPARQEALAALAAARMRERGYEGVDVDFEFVYPEYAAAYAEFVGVLRARVNEAGYNLIAALAPKTSATQPGILYEGHDYRLIGRNADAVLLMTYEWGYTYGPPMAVAPLPSVRRVLDYGVSEIPGGKLLLGFPNYAYDWTLPYTPGESRARSLSNPEAVELAVREGAEIRFDETAQTPYFYYTAADGQVHEVWFEDVRSSYAKFRLVEEYGMLGLGYWNFMRPFPGNFSLLNVMFDIASAPIPL